MIKIFCYTLAGLVAGLIVGYFLRQSATFGSLAFPTATQESTTTGWADDGTVVRLDSSSDTVGIGTTTPSRTLGLIGDQIIAGSSGTTTLIISSSASGRGGCIELEATNGAVISLYASSGPSTYSPTTPVAGLEVRAGSCE